MSPLVPPGGASDGQVGEKLATLAPPDEDARDRSIAAFRADLKAMMDLVADPETGRFAPCGGSSAPGTTSRLDVETRGRGPARARDGPMRGASFRGPVRTMIRAAPTARIGASAVPRDARSAITSAAGYVSQKESLICSANSGRSPLKNNGGRIVFVVRLRKFG